MALESIAFIPLGYKANKLYCQLPVDGGADLTTSRASGATRVNKNGLIEDVATGIPRLDYTNGGCPELLLEPQSTNEITYSEDFSNVAWTNLGSVTTNTDAVLSPDGSVNADEIVSVATGTQQGKLDGVSATSGLNYTFSVFVKYKDAQYVQLVIGGLGFGGTDYANFDIQNGVIGDEGVSDSAKIVDYGSGWYRISLTATATSTNAGSGSVTFIDSSTASRNATFSGTIGSGVYLFGGQLEQLSYSTSYIRTSGTTATRIADAVSGATGLTDEINSSEGVLYFEGSFLTDEYSSFAGVSLRDLASLNDSVQIRANIGSSNVLQFYIFDGGVEQVGITYIASDITQNFKVAFKYELNNVKVYLNGSEIASDTSATMPSGMNQLSFINNGFRVKGLKVYDTALTDAELTTLTS